MTLGERLRQRRAELGMDAKVLADLLVISPQYLSDIEHDRRSPTDETFLERLAAAYQLPEAVVAFYAGVIPARWRGVVADDAAILAAWKAFGQVLERDAKR